MSSDLPVTAFLDKERRMMHQFQPHKLFANTQWIRRFLNGENPPPITLELDPTLLCNDKCPNCVQGWALGRRELSVEQIDRVLSEANELGIRGLTLTGGGDPLMHSRILDVINLVPKYNFEAGLYTNGGAMNKPGVADALVNTFTWVRISLDSGSEKNFRAIRGHGGYQRRLDCLTALAEARQRNGSDCMIGASFLTSDMVTEDIVQAAKDVRDAGLDYVYFKPMIEWDLATDHHLSSSMNQDGVFQAIQEAATLRTDTFRVIGGIEKYRPEALGEERVYSQYHGARVVAAVAPDPIGTGEVKPTLYLECSVKYLYDRWAIGSFNSLRQILASEAREKMIRETSSDVYRVLPEKGCTYSHILDAVLQRHAEHPLSDVDIRALAPDVAEHPFSL